MGSPASSRYSRRDLRNKRINPGGIGFQRDLASGLGRGAWAAVARPAGISFTTRPSVDPLENR
jgi:hypothetical protein